jgi:predicted DNA-binding transcriptional regulator YafY
MGEQFCARMNANLSGSALRLLMITLLGAWASSFAYASDQTSTTAPVSVSDEAKLPSIHDLLVQAIREKRVLRFTYRGHARVVEPHAYGRNTKGEAVLHAFQTEGTSASRPPPGWRTFTASAIEQLKVGELSFAQARDGYSPNELRLAPLWAEVPALVAEE